MVSLSALWLPILLASVLVFLASSVIHMFSPWHKNDYAQLANEDAVMDAMRPLGIPPGDYLMPRPSSREEMSSPAFLEKVRRGPVVVMTVMTGQMSMGRNLGLWFVYLLVVSFFSAYVTSRAVPAGAPYLEVFRFSGVSAFLGFSLALWQLSIWYQRGWRITLKATVDGFVYALLTAGVFGWLWP